MQITFGDFNFIFQFSPIPSNLNKTIPTSFCILSNSEVGAFKPSKGPFRATAVNICCYDYVSKLTLKSLYMTNVTSDMQFLIIKWRTCDSKCAFTIFRFRILRCICLSIVGKDDIDIFP